ncbi:MAG: CheR family methyltransferase, partial [Polyangiaceae bacterium]
AIGIVLSGTGSDGTLGLGAIQREGGITFAQDATAKYDAMPRSAIAAGCVDLVLPPDEIGRKLAHLAARGKIAIGTDAASPDEEENLAVVIAALRKGTGIDFSQYRRTTVQRRVQRRMVVQHIEDLRAYAEFLAQTPSEGVALAEDILIHVTSFFRDAEAFEALKTEVFPRLIANRPQGMPIRIWVPGCSSGEEVYSIAIALSEFLGDAKADVPVKLFGTDISEIALEKARAGRYVENIALDVSAERLRRYFVAMDGGYRIQRSVRDMCVFAKQDVTRDPPFSNMDLVSCRNLLIYLGPALQSRVLPVFHYALHERGFLLLGASESVTAHPGFTVLDAKNKIFARSPVQLQPLLDFGDPRRVYGAPLATRPGSHAATQIEIQQAADRAVISQYAPRGVVVTDDLVIVQFRGETGAYLQPPPGAATFDLLRMVHEELRLELRQALDEARKTRKPAHRRVGGSGKPVEIGVFPFTAAELQRPLYAIVFDEPSSQAGPAAASPVREAGDVEQALRGELAQTRDYLQSVIEQLEAGNEELKAANEEIVSSNEELQSTNEELQTAKEELQAANEELATINQEMMERNREATRLSDDLANVLTSASIPILILGRDGKIRRFTPAAGKLLHLIGADVGRPLGDIKPALEGADLMAIVAEVIDQLVPVERSVKDANGRWYSVVVRPYMTLDNRIDGAVIVLLDVDALKKGEQAIADARDFSESIVDTVREGLVVLDEDLRVRSANRPFYHHFALSPDDVVKRPLSELGSGQWNNPALLRELESVRLG